MSFTHLWFWTLVLRLSVAAVAGWVLSFLLTRASIRLALRFDVVARPNHRTSHEGVVPRIGGIGLAGSFLLALGIAGIWMWATKSGVGGGAGAKSPSPWHLAPGFFWTLLAGGAGAFFLGLWDDVRSLPALMKLVVQVLVALAPPLLGVRLVRFGLPGLGPWTLPPVIGGAVAFLWVLFWMNAYNFMDGINGIAGRFGEVLALSLLIVSIGPFPMEALFLAFLTGACYGFLLWNFPRARTFMGDCGSQFLGFLFAVWTLHYAAELTPVKAVFPAMIVLTLPFLWDVVYTLIRRAVRGENLLKAHRSHLYQRLTSTGLDHAQTLIVCERTFYACAVPAVLVVAFSSPANILLQWGGLAFPFLAMIVYTRSVWDRERAASEKAGPSSQPPAAPTS